MLCLAGYQYLLELVKMQLTENPKFLSGKRNIEIELRAHRAGHKVVRNLADIFLFSDPQHMAFYSWFDMAA